MPLGAPVVACCVYRSKNAEHVRAFVSQLPPGADVRLHALDAIVPALADRTMSDGAGMRMPLLENLIESVPLDRAAWLVLFDDDVEFARPGRSDFLDVAAKAGFDVAQPAIEPGQPHSHEMTLTRVFSLARRTRLVEVGPVVAFSPRARAALLPFPEWAEMGWGLDFTWAEIAGREGIAMGIVDVSPIRHWGAIAAEYDADREWALKETVLERSGPPDPRLFTWVRPRWLPWRSTPPWL